MNKITVESPSNIALIKYWGKFGKQFPRNPSLSFTLSKAKTILTLEVAKKNNQDEVVDLEFTFAGKSNDKFKAKMVKFLLEEKIHFDHLLQHKIIIHSENTFPHSSGIASSASSMSAFVFAALKLEFTLSGSQDFSDENFLNKASSLSRIASGSASRSLFSGLALWGDYEKIGNNDWAVGVEHLVDPRFKNFRDAIVIVSAEEKAVSSRAGHALMDHHPYREVRFSIARERLSQLLLAMKNYDLETFIKIVETEALDLHSLMMTSDPSFILLEPKTLEVIKLLRNFRLTHQIPVCFTLDAGPNLHVLYPAEFSEAVDTFLLSLNLPIINDQVGFGTTVVSSDN